MCGADMELRHTCVVVHWIEVRRVRRPHVRASLVKQISDSHFGLFPEVWNGAESCCHPYDRTGATISTQDFITVHSGPDAAQNRQLAIKRN